MKPAIKQFTHAFFKIPQNERKKNGRKGARIAGYEPYSPEEDAYLIEHYQKIPFTQIGKNLGRSAHSIYVRSKKLIRDGLIVNDQRWRKSHYSAKEDAFIIACQDKMSFEQVGHVLGRSRESVKVRAGKLGVSYRKVAETSPVVKLLNDDVELIRQLAELGLTYREISYKFDVDESHVRKVCMFQERLYLDKNDYLNHVKRQKDAIDAMN
ncbi:TPA: DNA-binding protein [Vibrio parahaemolyticus]